MLERGFHGRCLTTCTSAAGTARAHNLLTGVARAPARDGPVSSKCGLGGTSKRAARTCPRAAHPRMCGESGPATLAELHLPPLILASSRGPGKEGRAGPLERRAELNRWDAGRPHGLGRQPPSSPVVRWRGAQGRPRSPAGRPLTAEPGAPRPARRDALREWGSSTINSVVEGERNRFPPNDLRFCCGAC